MSYYPPTDWELKDFYREHVDALYRSCCFLTCGEADALAMVQQIFLKLLNKGMIFSSDKDAKAWMILTAYKMSRKPPKPVPEQEDVPANPQEQTEQISDSAEGAVTQTEEATAVTEDSVQEEPATEEEKSEESAVTDENITLEEQKDVPAGASEPPAFPAEIRKLSRRDRLIALLYYCEGYRKAEIADLLGWPTFSVGTRLKRIKKRILQETGGDEAC